MIELFSILKDKNKPLSSLFPPIGFGWLSVQGYVSPCQFQILPIEFVYTGFPLQFYIGATAISTLTGSIILALLSLGKTPSDTKSRVAIDMIWPIHALIEFLMVISILIRWCKLDLVLGMILFITVVLWLVPVIQRRLVMS